MSNKSGLPGGSECKPSNYITTSTQCQAVSGHIQSGNIDPRYVAGLETRKKQTTGLILLDDLKMVEKQNISFYK